MVKNIRLYKCKGSQCQNWQHMKTKKAKCEKSKVTTTL